MCIRDSPESVAITFSVGETLVAPSITSPATTCSTDLNTFTVGNAVVGYTYKWTLNGAAVATGNPYNIAAGSLAAGTYTLGVYGESGTCSTSLVTQTLTITDPSTLTIDTGLTADTVCEGDSFTITVSDTQSSNTTYTLSYPGGPQVKNSSSGQVTFTLSLASKGDISVTAVSLAGCIDTVTKTVNIPKINSAGTISTNQGALCYGGSISSSIFSTAPATLTVDSSTASITYKWYYSTDGQNTWIPIGTNTSTLVTSTLTSLAGLVTDTIFKREVYASIGGCLLYTSDAADE